MKIVLFLALIGHILCGYTDCLFTFSPSGARVAGSLKDYEMAHKNYEDMPLRNILLGMLLGVLALTISIFGYLGLANWMKSFSETAALIMYIATIVFFVPIVPHHVFCGVVEWFFVKLGRTPEAFEAVKEFFKKTIATMFVGYAGIAVFCVTLFVMIISGQTDLPRWVCIFNTAPLFLLLLPTKLPAKGNIAGAIMFLGLLFLI